MKDLYEVKVERVDANDGRFVGYDHIAWVADGHRAEVIARDYVEKIAGEKNWWIIYGKDVFGKPNVRVVYMGELVE